MFCIEPGGDPSLVLPFSPPAANWGPVELNANYNRPAALQNWLSMPGSSILGLMVLKRTYIMNMYILKCILRSITVQVSQWTGFPSHLLVEQVGWGSRLVLCVNVLRFVDIV